MQQKAIIFLTFEKKSVRSSYFSHGRDNFITWASIIAVFVDFLMTHLAFMRLKWWTRTPFLGAEVQVVSFRFRETKPTIQLWFYGSQQESGQELTLVAHEVGLWREHKLHILCGSWCLS